MSSLISTKSNHIGHRGHRCHYYQGTNLALRKKVEAERTFFIKKYKGT